MSEAYPIPELLRQPVEAPRERPILFSSPMVRAILSGSKTQTRRVVKPQPQPNGGAGLHLVAPHQNPYGQWAWVLSATGMGSGGDLFSCPYGRPGDRLWVREAWRPNWTVEHGHVVEFSADNAISCFNGCCNGLEVVQPGYDWLTAHYDCYKKPWRPSIHMPRWASRILLEIVSVRVERLNEISAADAKAEGLIELLDHDWDDCEHPIPSVAYQVAPGETKYSNPAQAYRALWESINGAGSWSANPWVWVVEFRRIAR